MTFYQLFPYFPPSFLAFLPPSFLPSFPASFFPLSFPSFLLYSFLPPLSFFLLSFVCSFIRSFFPSFLGGLWYIWKTKRKASEGEWNLMGADSVQELTTYVSLQSTPPCWWSVLGRQACEARVLTQAVRYPCVASCSVPFQINYY